MIWAGIIGFAGAVCSIAYRVGTSFVHKILTGSSASGLVESFTELPLWGRLVVPAIGGLIAGAIIHFGSRFRGQVTTTDYMEAVVLGDGRISARQSLVKSLSALFTNASGGSIGREGPLVQLAAMVASLAGRLQRWTTPRLRLLVACGAAAGIASAYNAPISGSVFVAEIVLGSMAMEIFGPLVFASVIATLTVRGFLGPGRFIKFRCSGSTEIGRSFHILLLGLAIRSRCAVVYPVTPSEREMGRPDFRAGLIKMCAGGLVVGALAVFYPQVCGNGYSVVNEILGGHWLWQTLALILIFKVLATAATFGSGAVGGVFTPTLFVGASLGFLFGTATQHVTGSAF